MKQLLNLNHLKFFCDAVSSNSISESAKQNFVTQSTVSQAINKLEIVLGVKLTIHSKQKFQITVQGKILFDESRHIFKSLYDLENKIHEESTTVKGNLRFGCTNSLGMSFITPIYKLMQENFPQVKLNIKLGNDQSLKQALQQNEIEFALSVSEDHPSFSRQVLKRGQFNLYQHKLAPNFQIEEGIFIDFKEGLFIKDLLHHFEADNPLKIQAELAGWEVVARFVEQNLGIGFFPDYILYSNRYPDLQPCSLKIPSFEYAISAYSNKGSKSSNPAQAFLDLIKQKTL